MAAFFDPNPARAGTRKEKHVTPEELKKLQEMYELKRSMEAAAEAESTPPAATAMAERTPAPSDIPAPQQPAAETRDPNAERFGQGIFTQRSTPSEGDEERRWRQVHERYGPGMRTARLLRASAASQALYRDNTQEGVCRVLSDQFHDRGMTRYAEQLYERNTASSQRPIDGGILVPMEESDGLLELLYPFLVLAQLGCTFVTNPSGTLSYPVQKTGGGATYNNENEHAKKQNTPTFGTRNWVAKQLSSLFVMPRTLIQRSNYDVDRIFRNDAGMQMAQAMEQAALEGNGQNSGIKGLSKYDGLTTVTLGNALINENNILDFEDELLSNNISMMARPGWLFNHKTRKALMQVNVTDEGLIFRKEMKDGTLMGHPYSFTQNISTGGGTGKPANVYFGDWAELWIVRQGQLEVAASTEAAYEDGATVKAAFGRNQVVVRMLDFHDIAPRRTESIARCKDAYTEAAG